MIHLWTLLTLVLSLKIYVFLCKRREITLLESRERKKPGNSKPLSFCRGIMYFSLVICILCGPVLGTLGLFIQTKYWALFTLSQLPPSDTRPLCRLLRWHLEMWPLRTSTTWRCVCPWEMMSSCLAVLGPAWGPVAQLLQAGAPAGVALSSSVSHWGDICGVARWAQAAQVTVHWKPGGPQGHIGGLGQQGLRDTQVGLAGCFLTQKWMCTEGWGAALSDLTYNWCSLNVV